MCYACDIRRTIDTTNRQLLVGFREVCGRLPSSTTTLPDIGMSASSGRERTTQAGLLFFAKGISPLQAAILRFHNTDKSQRAVPMIRRDAAGMHEAFWSHFDGGTTFHAMFARSRARMLWRTDGQEWDVLVTALILAAEMHVAKLLMDGIRHPMWRDKKAKLKTGHAGRSGQVQPGARRRIRHQNKTHKCIMYKRNCVAR